MSRANVNDCQDCGRDRGRCECTEFLPSQALELWELAQQMRADPEFDPGWPFGDLIRERGWASATTCTRRLSTAEDDEDTYACGRPATVEALTTSGQWEPHCAPHVVGWPTDRIRHSTDAVDGS